MEKRKISIYVGVIFLVLGIFWALSVLSNIVGTVYFLNKSIRTEGKILDKAWKSHDRSGDVYFFKVSFVSTKGDIINFTSNILNNDNSGSFSIGENVPVLYNKDNSQDAKIDTFSALWDGDDDIVFGLLGIGFIFIAAVNLISELRNKKQR